VKENLYWWFVLKSVVGLGERIIIRLSRKMSTFGIHRLDWLMVSKRFPWNTKYGIVYRYSASFIVICTITYLKS
jgi:hypothetical protein